MVEAPHSTSADVAGLIERMDEAAAAYIRGDARHYLTLVGHPQQYTLCPPYGGEPVHRGAPTDEEIEATSRFFESGEARFEATESYAAGDLVVLVGAERQHGVVGGGADQDWSLRVTLVLQRSADGWTLVHRHADPLVRPIPWDLFARIARGDVADGGERDG